MITGIKDEQVRPNYDGGIVIDVSDPEIVPAARPAASSAAAPLAWPWILGGAAAGAALVGLGAGKLTGWMLLGAAAGAAAGYVLEREIG